MPLLIHELPQRPPAPARARGCVHGRARVAGHRKEHTSVATVQTPCVPGIAAGPAPALRPVVNARRDFRWRWGSRCVRVSSSHACACSKVARRGDRGENSGTAKWITAWDGVRMLGHAWCVRSFVNCPSGESSIYGDYQTTQCVRLRLNVDHRVSLRNSTRQTGTAGRFSNSRRVSYCKLICSYSYFATLLVSRKYILLWCRRVTRYHAGCAKATGDDLPHVRHQESRV